MSVDDVEIRAVDGVELVAVAGVRVAGDVDFGAPCRCFNACGELDVARRPIDQVDEVDAECCWVDVEK